MAGGIRWRPPFIAFAEPEGDTGDGGGNALTVRPGHSVGGAVKFSAKLDSLRNQFVIGVNAGYAKTR